MDLTQIRSFHCIATLGSITKAAEAVHRSQPAVSQQLRSLENELGHLLFERIGKQRMILTPAGKRFLLFAEQTIAALETTCADLDALAGNTSGQVTISAAATTLGLMLAEVVRRFRSRHPDAMLTLFDRHPAKGLELLREGRVDFAVCVRSQVPDHVESREWSTGHFVLWVPKWHPLASTPRPSLDEIAAYPFIKLIGNARFASAVKIEDAFRSQGIKYNMLLEAGNVHVIAEYVRRGQGISVVFAPEGDLDLYPEELTTIQLDHLFPPETVCICYRPKASLSATAKDFLAMACGQDDAGEQPGEAVPPGLTGQSAAEASQPQAPSA